MSRYTVESNYGSDWANAINPDGTVKKDAIFVNDPYGDDITLHLEEVNALIEALVEASNAIDSAQVEALKPKLPTEPGLYVHKRFASEPMHSPIIYALHPAGGWHRDGNFIDVQTVEKDFSVWGGFAKLEAAVI